MKLFLRTLKAIWYGSCFVAFGFCLGLSMTYYADRMVVVAKLNESAARFQAMESLYGSVKWQAVVENANHRAERAEAKLAAVCRKRKC